jgi:hypothetical protein
MGYLGVIEGFFGRTWSFEQREQYASFLAEQGYQFYIYAPKNDAYLRKAWQQDWPEDDAVKLQKLIHTYQQQGLDFGLGLSPFEIYLNYDDTARNALQEKIKRLNKLGANTLCLLFDDMDGNVPQLAAKQIAICQDVAAQTTAKRIILCPTYYSFDPKLEKCFGQMPEDYWIQLGQKLDKNIDLFWTGPEICSTNYPEDHLTQVTELLGRKPFLWDNYPVNDGATLSNFLHLKAFENRPARLAIQCSGHAVNPMNQAWLSKIPLYSLPKSYALATQYQPELIFSEALTLLCGKELAQHIEQDISYFQQQGLSALSKEQQIELRNKYQSFNSPYAQEITAWLNNEYQFDSACLTG